LVFAQTISLVGCAKDGTGFSVFYNAAKLLHSGARAGIYSRSDVETGWLITIPTFGQGWAFLQLFVSTSVPDLWRA
jgi:hypothetical protein